METIFLRPAEPDRHFAQLAALFTSVQDEPTTESALKVDYEEHKARIFRLMVAEDERGELLGFNWSVHSRFDRSQAYIYLIVRPEQRQQGAGSRLYDDLEQAARKAQVGKLLVTLRDDCPECRAFAEKRAFSESSHSIAMVLDLDAFDDRPYDEIIERLQGEGFQFTSMGALGDTQEAQRKLYQLNETTGMETPGSGGQPSWLSFEDFQKKVCQAEWYKPDGQKIAIDAATGDWAAMSAITCFEGTDYAYNLHTGVDRRYRGRKLGQAIKVTALRYAREILKAHTVRTHHSSLNLPMIAIDRKFGYVQAPGTFTMEKLLL
jgi:GNAT superfamily N-acetyltransferase